MPDFISVLTSQWIYTAFAIIALGSTLVIIMVILSENRNPVKSLAWVTVLLLLPVVGLILYLFFGRNIKNTRMISRRSRRRLRRREKRSGIDPRQSALDTPAIQQFLLGRSLTGQNLYLDNTVTVFTDGRAKFDSLEEDLRQARQVINLQYYIFEDDELGHRISDVLIERAQAGVKVRVIYDHVGSFAVRSHFFRRLKEGGVEVGPFFRVTFPQLATRINWRNHRKICIIDNRIGYIGGMNIAGRYIDGGKKFDSWRDTHLRITGPAVAALESSFCVDWSFMGGALFDEPEADAAPVRQPEGAISGVAAQLLTSGPTSQWPNIAMAFHKAIVSARRRVYIQTPYFLPNDSLLKALQTAALAHVDVRVMLPERSDSAMLSLASASYLAECLRAGVKFYFYKAGMLHSKMLIIDDDLSSVGSTNFDFRSFECNFEANIFIHSKEFTSKLIEIFKDDLTRCERVKPTRWRHRPTSQKIGESVLRLLSPIL